LVEQLYADAPGDHIICVSPNRPSREPHAA
jgi:hypothetical protein